MPDPTAVDNTVASAAGSPALAPSVALDPLESPRRWLVPRAGEGSAWVETVGITLAALGLGGLANLADPLNVGAQFPWVWFAPVLVALRYGAIPGVASAAILIATWYGFHIGAEVETPKFLFLGGLLLTLVCGEYGAAWRTRLRRSGEIGAYLEDRVERVTRRLYLLRLSHERLEQELISRPVTMRDALAQLRVRLIERAGEGPLPGADAFLQFLAQHCQLEGAALHVPEGDADGFRRVATVGNAPPLDRGDPLLAYALETGMLAHVRTDAVVSTATTPHLVVAPVTTGAGRLLGVLSVNRMPFFALTQDTLQLMGVLLGAYADIVDGGERLAAVAAALPDAPEEFVDELTRLLRIQREHGVGSHMVVMLFDDSPNALDAHQLVLRQRRSPDVVWSPRRAGHRAAFVNLLAISGSASIDGYLLRTETALRETFAKGFQELRIRPFVIPLSDPDPVASLVEKLGPAVAPSGSPASSQGRTNG